MSDDACLVTNLEVLCDELVEKIGSKTIKFVFAKYRCSSLSDLSPSRYREVFAELYQLLND